MGSLLYPRVGSRGAEKVACSILVELHIRSGCLTIVSACKSVAVLHSPLTKNIIRYEKDVKVNVSTYMHISSGVCFVLLSFILLEEDHGQRDMRCMDLSSRFR